ncbi:hypothetical protein AAFF_G00197700 [Aldrovandia affinis]|uniref:Reverse transcriptase/retrotransposon-derived protein RNase H-like domain-containing protein n=1 Tax=Aldrovandia affinis TaxID=143900 RepID=A0AAD7RIV1_9TELE|nr:hypothetical protein AAFF_G00197700 [Aldrovandia affinis]
MTSIKRSSPGAIPEPGTPSLPLLPRWNATLVSGSEIELREVEEAIRELEERLGVQRRRKTGATETATSAELQGPAVRQERAPERPDGVSVVRPTCPAMASSASSDQPRRAGRGSPTAAAKEERAGAAEQQELALHALLQALTPEQLRQHVILATPRSLDEALKEAERAVDVLCLAPGQTARVREADCFEEEEEVRSPPQQRRQRPPLAGLRLNPWKCQLLRRETAFLGHVVCERGVATDPAKVTAVQDWLTPANVGELRSFLGLASYYRHFVWGFASIASPLHRLTDKYQPFVWTKEWAESRRALPVHRRH